MTVQPDQGLALGAQYASGGSVLNGIPNGSNVPPSASVWLGADAILYPSGFVPHVQTATPGDEGNLRPAQPRANYTLSAGDVQAQWYNMTAGQRKAVAQRIFALGYIKSPNDLDGAQSVLNGAISASAISFALGKNVSPFDWLTQNASENADELARRKAVGPGGIVTSKQINLADRDSAEAIATNALQTALGRMPTTSELNTFYNTLVAKEKAHPDVQQSQVDSSGNVVAGSTQTVQQGVGSDSTAIQAELANQIAQNPEVRALQSATTYLGALKQALGSPGGVGTG